MKSIRVVSVAVVAFVLSCLALAQQEPLIQVRGSVQAATDIKGLLFAPCDDEGRPYGPPILAAVGPDGKFCAALKAGRYHIGSNPPCAIVTDMDIDQSGSDVSLSEGTPQKERNADPGTYTGRSFFEFNYNSQTGLSLNFGFTRNTLGVETRNLTSKISLLSFLPKLLPAFNSQDKISGAGGIKLISDLCENAQPQVHP